MTALRQRMIEDLQLRGLAPNTQGSYVRAVRQLAEHYGKSPDRINEEEVRQYFLYLKNDKQVAPKTLGVALAGVKFLYVHTLKREWRTLDLVRRSRERIRIHVAASRHMNPYPLCEESVRGVVRIRSGGRTSQCWARRNQCWSVLPMRRGTLQVISVNGGGQNLCSPGYV